MNPRHVAEWTRCQREQRRLCAVLEQIAERLPLHEVGLGGSITDTLAEVHRFEESELFPAMASMSRQVAPLLEDFTSHHRHDRAEAAAIQSALDEKEIGNASDLKARIRTFAEGIRRHVQFEEAICRAMFARRDAGERAVQ